MPARRHPARPPPASSDTPVMHVDVRRPDRIRIAVRQEEQSSGSTRRVWLELAARGLARGCGGRLRALGRAHAPAAAGAGVAVIGVIAIGAALLSWDR